MTDSEKYMVNVDDLKKNWGIQRQRKMVTIRNNANPILFDHLEEIIVDDPRVELHKIAYFNEGVNAMKNVIGDNPLKNKISMRNCTNCYCRDNYLKQISKDKLDSIFLLK